MDMAFANPGPFLCAAWKSEEMFLRASLRSIQILYKGEKIEFNTAPRTGSSSFPNHSSFSLLVPGCREFVRRSS